MLVLTLQFATRKIRLRRIEKTNFLSEHYKLQSDARDQPRDLRHVHLKVLFKITKIINSKLGTNTRYSVNFKREKSQQITKLKVNK